MNVSKIGRHGCSGLLHFLPGCPQRKDAMKQYEYKREYVAQSPKYLQDELLKQLGLEGWELCAIDNVGKDSITFYFKRERMQE